MNVLELAVVQMDFAQMELLNFIAASFARIALRLQMDTRLVRCVKMSRVCRLRRKDVVALIN